MGVYLASVQTLEEDDSYRPHIHLVGDLRRLFAHNKTLGRKIPGTHTHTHTSVDF